MHFISPVISISEKRSAGWGPNEALARLNSANSEEPLSRISGTCGKIPVHTDKGVRKCNLKKGMEENGFTSVMMCT